MKDKFHPEYGDSMISCACGNTIQTRSTKKTIHVNICSNCHPFYTGKQKLVDAAGRVERFQKRFAKMSNTKKQRSDPPAPEEGSAEQAS
ncbi:MAG: 50S ribosomal protein L31 [Candidatus Omnitrophota bacterium]